MKILKGGYIALILIGLGYSSSIFADPFQTRSLKLISDDQLRSIDAQGDPKAFHNIQQVQNIILNLGLNSDHAQEGGLNTKQKGESSLVNTELKMIEKEQGLDVNQSHVLLQGVLQHLLSNIQALNPKVSMQQNQMLFQFKNIHIERIEIDMNMAGLYSLIDPVGVTKSFVTSNVTR